MNDVPSRLEQLGFQLGRAWYAYLGLLDRLLAESNLGDDVQPGMGNVLFALFEQDGQTMGSLARRLRLSKSAVTRLVRRVGKAGLVETTADTQDRRSTRVHLTPRAETLRERCLALADRVQQTLCDDLDDDEAASLTKLLERVTETIRRHSQQADERRQLT
ncbi:MAG: MarR family transcriptional regulator [Pirellulaceae bacterium]